MENKESYDIPPVQGTEKRTSLRDRIYAAGSVLKEIYKTRSPAIYSSIKASKVCKGGLSAKNWTSEFIDDVTLEYPKASLTAAVILASTITYGATNVYNNNKTVNPQTTKVEQKAPTPKLTPSKHTGGYDMLSFPSAPKQLPPKNQKRISKAKKIKKTDKKMEKLIKERNERDKKALEARIKSYEIKHTKKDNAQERLELTNAYRAMAEAYVSGDIKGFKENFGDQLYDADNGLDSTWMIKKMEGWINGDSLEERTKTFENLKTTIYNDKGLLQLYKKRIVKYPIRPGDMALLNSKGYFMVWRKKDGEWKIIATSN